MDGLQELNDLRDYLLPGLASRGKGESPLGRETIPAFILPYQLKQPFRLNRSLRMKEERKSTLVVADLLHEVIFENPPQIHDQEEVFDFRRKGTIAVF